MEQSATSKVATMVSMPFDENSFTTKLFKDNFLLKRKIMEEAFEVVNFEQGDGLSWEVADLAYFVLTFMVENGVTAQEIINNLASRAK